MNLAKIFNSRAAVSIFIIVTAAFVVLILTQNILFTIKPLQELENKFIDFRFLERGSSDELVCENIIVIEITQETYDQIPHPYNRWPWPRDIFANLIENLNEAGAKAIGIDILMSGSDSFSPSNDSLLFDVIDKYENVVVAGKVDIELESMLDEQRIERSLGSNKAIKRELKSDFGNIFFEADSSVGIVQVPKDDDGIARRYQPFVYSSAVEKRIPTFGFALLNKYFELPSLFTPTINLDENQFTFLNTNIPRFDASSFLINFRRADQKSLFPTVQFMDVLDDSEFQTTDEIDLEIELNTWDDPEHGLLYSGLFENKIVIIGSTMPEDRDLVSIPPLIAKRKGDNQIYGVYYHANAIHNVLSHDFLYIQDKLLEAFFILLLTAVSFYLSVVFRKIRFKYGVLLELANIISVLILLLIYFEITNWLFLQHKYLMSMVGPSMALIVGYFGSTAYHYFRERRQNVMIKGMFSQYVSASLVNQLLDDPSKLRLGGEKKELTVLFSDIIGFTEISEKRTPEDLVKFMNKYLSEMTNIIISYQGTLDKYLGDAIMAFWGAPIPIEDHAYLACLTAIDMRKEIQKMLNGNEFGRDLNLDIRIGINTGEVVVGNMGGEKRFDYTVMGDDVNLASRLEGANKQYGTRIMISESTYILAGDRLLVRVLDTIRVKGKTKPTKVFELIGRKDDPESIDRMQKLKHYFKGLNEYNSRNFEKALAHFDLSIQQLPDDRPSWTYFERCQFYLNNPPSEDWDGVFELKTK
ncbi:MAG: adenylate/guanylate cyclase domain-containing protein [Melioribacteraceae bacterium]|nr:adenylate/guanylate cyclase domain-containing protein [Melioribacteraceae bacterium]